MGILKIDEESFDPLMGDIWEVWPQGWGDNEQRVRAFCGELLDAIIERAGYFHYALGHAVVTSHVSYRKIPEHAFNEVDKVAVELVKIIRNLEPEQSKYITIKFGSSISGGGSCIPNIEIRYDSKWFGKNFNDDSLGPWHQRHATHCVHLKYKVGRYKSWGGSDPIPKFNDIYPEIDEWPKSDWCWDWNSEQSKHEEQVFFPEGEQLLYPKVKQ